MRIFAAVCWLLLSPNFIFSRQLFAPAKKNLRAISDDADSVRVAWVRHYSATLLSNFSAKPALDRHGNFYITGKTFDRNETPGFLTIKYNAFGKEQWATWHKGASDYSSAITHIALDSTGNIYVAGSSPGANGLDDYVIIKYNPAGKLQWSVRYDSPFKQNDHIMALAVDSQGNAYVTGNSFSNANWDWATVKYNAAGEEQWVTRRDGTANGSWDETAALAVDRDGNVYVTGWTTGLVDQANYVTVKYDADGVMRWIARYNNPQHSWSSDQATALALDVEGNVYVTGRSILGNAPPQYVTIKYNSAGVQEWSVKYENVSDGVLPLIAVDAAGNVYVAGTGSCASGNTDALAIKYDRHGALLWTACYNSPTPGGDYINALALDDSSNLYVAGASVATVGSDFLLLKYDRAGRQKWLARFKTPASKFNAATGLAFDKFGQIYVTGYSSDDRSSQFTTIKYVQQGVASRYDLQQNFPNPFTTSTTIRFAVPWQTQVKLTIYDVLGREVAKLMDEEIPAGEYEKIWRPAPLPATSGTFFLRMQTPEFTSAKKLVRVK